MIDSPFVRGDIWLVDFGADPTDPEQALRRPAVVVSDDQLHHPKLKMVIVVPGTSTLQKLPIHVETTAADEIGLVEPTAFQVEQVRAVSTSRCIDRLGRLDAVSRHTLDEVLRNVLGLH